MIAKIKDNKSYPKISIRLGLESDINKILSLQSYWLGKSPENKKGFLFGRPYTNKQILKIVSKAYIMVAVVNENFAGFFLIDDTSGNELTNQYENLLNDFHQHFKGTTCPRAQIAIKPEYLGLGISYLLTQKLISHMKDSYDSVFSLVSKKNKNLNKHLQNGWEVIHEDHEMYYVKLKFNPG